MMGNNIAIEIPLISRHLITIGKSDWTPNHIKNRWALSLKRNEKVWETLWFYMSAL